MNCKGYKYALVLLGLFACIHLQTQAAISLHINEISAINKTIFPVDYRDKYSWFEHFNLFSEAGDVADSFLAETRVLHSGERLESIKDNDKLGFGMTIIAIGVVFLGLIGLYLLFNVIGSIAISLSHKRAMKTYGMSKEAAKDIAKQSGDVYAAIALAIYEATEFHDDENTILTIKNTVRNYSPWSSKIYTLRETPKK